MALSNTIYQLILVGEHLGNRTQNAFWFTDKSTSLQDDELQSLTKLMNDFDEWVRPSYALALSSSWHGLGLIGRIMAGTSGWMLEMGYSTVSGGQDAESLPSDCAVVVALDTALSGRSHRGRIFLPGLAKNSAEGNFLTGSALGQFVDFANNLAGRFAVSGTSLDHVYSVYSHKLGDVRNPEHSNAVEQTMAGITLVQQLHVRKMICSMRRRRPDHGI